MKVRVKWACLWNLNADAEQFCVKEKNKITVLNMPPPQILTKFGQTAESTGSGENATF